MLCSKIQNKGKELARTEEKSHHGLTIMCEMCGYDMYTISLEKEEKYVIARNMCNETNAGWLLRPHPTQREYQRPTSFAVQMHVEC